MSVEETASTPARVNGLRKSFDVDFDLKTVSKDLIRIIVQFLQEQGLVASASILQDEANVRLQSRSDDQSTIRRMRKSVLHGNWPDVEKMLAMPLFQSQRSFQYAVQRTRFLEFIAHNERQKAFTHLTRRLKPLEKEASADEFRDLCYLLTSGSVGDVASFRSWTSVAAEREKLAHLCANLVSWHPSDGATVDGSLPENDSPVPSGRLLHLVRQALNYQLEFSRYHPPTAPHIETLLEDYTVSAVPNACRDVFDGHTSNVKLVTFLGDQGKLLASCSSDSTVRVWDVERARCALVLDEHQRRVWSVASGQRSGTVCVTASADATVKIWNVKSALEQREMGDDDEEKEGQGQGQRQRFESVESSATLVGHDGDVYTVAVHPAETHAVTAGYDKVVRLFDMQTGQLVDSFCGHALGVTSVAFNTHGNLVVTGSKDNTVRFWDVVSGVCVRTLDARHGEVTSVATNPANSQLLVATKDNSHRLWDLRMTRVVRRFRGHVNVSKNFVRASFGPTSSMVSSGSEDGVVHIWSIDSGDVVQRLRGHEGAAYGTAWCHEQGLLASAGDDAIVRTWALRA